MLAQDCIHTEIQTANAAEGMTRKMSGLTVAFGTGAVGRLVTEKLLARADPVRIAQRSPRVGASKGAQFVACDILDANAVRAAVNGTSQVLLSVGFSARNGPRNRDDPCQRNRSHSRIVPMA